MIKLYFGNRLYNEERDIHYLMRAWGQSLEAERASAGRIDFGCLDKKLDEFLARMHTFRSEMAYAMQAGKVGSARDDTIAEEHARPEALCVRGPGG